MRRSLRCTLDDSFDISSYIANQSADGSNTLGTISSALFNLGYTAQNISSALSNVANSVGGNPTQLSNINAELAYLNSGAPAQPTSSLAPILLIAAVAGLLFLA